MESNILELKKSLINKFNCSENIILGNIKEKNAFNFSLGYLIISVIVLFFTSLLLYINLNAFILKRESHVWIEYVMYTILMILPFILIVYLSHIVVNHRESNEDIFNKYKHWFNDLMNNKIKMNKEDKVYFYYRKIKFNLCDIILDKKDIEIILKLFDKDELMSVIKIKTTEDLTLENIKISIQDILYLLLKKEQEGSKNEITIFNKEDNDKAKIEKMFNYFKKYSLNKMIENTDKKIEIKTFAEAFSMLSILFFVIVINIIFITIFSFYNLASDNIEKGSWIFGYVFVSLFIMTLCAIYPLKSLSRFGEEKRITQNDEKGSFSKIIKLRKMMDHPINEINNNKFKQIKNIYKEEINKDYIFRSQDLALLKDFVKFDEKGNKIRTSWSSNNDLILLELLEMELIKESKKCFIDGIKD